MYISAIIVAAGRSKRLESRISKAVLKLNSRPVIAYSLGVLDKHPTIKEIIIVANNQNIKELQRIAGKNKPGRPLRIILGGKKRQDSVRNGLKVVNPQADFVLIHDAARPFISKSLVAALIKEAAKSGAAILGVPVKATVKVAQSSAAGGIEVKKTLKRENLWEIQTPQLFRKDLIFAAYKKFGRNKATDDAMLVERLGAKVKIVLGSYANLKITTPEDLCISGAIAKLWKRA